ncbi:MAG: hypothetical protein HZC54_06435 [Verrucomicrobia bacterium]|nr:hypothetical protein [Verrucomicrobiota bacterium]
MIKRLFVVGLFVAGFAVASLAQKGIEPVHYVNLIYCLPRTPEGYEKTKPAGVKMTTPPEVIITPTGERIAKGGANVTEASRQYANKANPKKVIRVKITDGAYNAKLYAEFRTFREASDEGATGYFKSYKMDGYPVHEHYAKQDRQGTLRGVIEGRFIIEITGFGVGPGELVEWWREIDIKRLILMH